MDSVIQDLVSKKCSASKVKLLNNFLKQWSRIDKQDKIKNKRLKRLLAKNKKTRKNNISTIQQQPTVSHQEESFNEASDSERIDQESFHYTPASPLNQATDSEQEEEEDIVCLD